MSNLQYDVLVARCDVSPYGTNPERRGAAPIAGGTRDSARDVACANSCAAWNQGLAPNTPVVDGEKLPYCECKNDAGIPLRGGLCNIDDSAKSEVCVTRHAWFEAAEKSVPFEVMKYQPTAMKDAACMRACTPLGGGDRRGNMCTCRHTQNFVRIGGFCTSDPPAKTAVAPPP